MKLPFTWSLSSVWQTATNTIRTTLNLTEKSKNTNAFLVKRQKPGSNQSTFATFSLTILPLFYNSDQTVWNYLSHEYCQVCGKRLQTPSERLWTWPKNQKKFLWFLLKRQKPGSNQSNIATFSNKTLTNFQLSLQRAWNYLSHEYYQVDGKTTQTPSERLWTWLKNRKKIMYFLLKRQKLGSNQSSFVTFSDKKLTNFQSSLQRIWNYLSHDHCQVDGKTTQTPSEWFWTWPKNNKIYCFFAKTAKVGVQSK